MSEIESSNIINYRELCEIEKTIPLFSQSWWLDVVASDSWDVSLVYDKNQIVGSLPYLKTKKWGFTRLSQPNLTQYLGPWIRPVQKPYSKKFAYEKDVLSAMINQLPDYDYYEQCWSCDYQNWLPFYWRGFQQTSFYTYRLKINIDKDELWRGLKKNIRSDIKKARDRLGVEVRNGKVEELLYLNELTFKRQGLTVPYTNKFIKKIDEAASLRNSRHCLVAVDPEGRLHAGVYILNSGNTAYYLVGGGDPELRNSGATSLVLWEAICRQHSSIEVFDFEGSMIEPIERYFRGFGSIQTPYFKLTHSKSKFYSRLKIIRTLFR